MMVTVDIESIAAGGDGVARHEGLVVFAPRTAPGDRVVANIEPRGRFARASVERVERPSGDRIEPACAHYLGDRCGGCQLQHLSLRAQREAKRGIVRDSLRRIGKREVELPAIRGGDVAWRYRRKLTLALRRRGTEWVAGLRAFDDPAHVFPLADCRIADERLVSMWKEIMRASALLPDATELRGSLRLLGDGGALVLEGANRWDTHADFFEAVRALVALWWVPEKGSRRLLHDRRGSVEPGASFVQVNPEVAAIMTRDVADLALARKPAHIIDAYSGAGDLPVVLASYGVRLTAIELDAEAGAWAASRLTPPSRALTGRVEDLLARALPADVVIVNPPRAGLNERVTATLESATPAPSSVIYVSCDPATLARDLARLTAFRIQSVTLYDMFPQTAHVESVVELVPAR